MKKVKAVEDGDGHWYVIPNELLGTFQNYMNSLDFESEDYELIDKFEEEFGQYKTGGDLNNTQLYVEI